MQGVDELETWVRSRGGAVRAADARAAGFTTYRIRRGVDSGDLARVRKNWLVDREVDPQVRAACEHGGRLTCVTAAQQRGWWVPAGVDGEPLHLVVPSTSSVRSSDRVRVHWATGPAPFSPSATSDHPLNILFQVARCIPAADALAVWESAVRLGHVDAAVLRGVRWRCAAASRLATLAGSLSDSGLETRFVVIARAAGISVRQQVRIDGHRVDGLIGERLVVQIDGFAHHRAHARREDLRQDVRLRLRGYTVLRFDYVQVLLHPEEVTAALVAAMAQGLHLDR